MKICLLMDAPSLPTGYGYTCRLTGREFIKRGHEVFCTDFNRYERPNGPYDYFGIKVIPNSALDRDRNANYGDAKLIESIEQEFCPDIYILHNDSYRYSYLKDVSDQIMRKCIFWLPFEGSEPDLQGLGIFKRCAATRFVTDYALEMHSGHLPGKDIGRLYHAVCPEMHPSPNKAEAKRAKALGVDNKFIVCRVDRHQPRKYWKKTIEAFAKFAQGKDDVFLLAKCNPRDITMYNDKTKEGEDLEAIANSLGLEGKYKFDDFFFNEEWMAKGFYHAADVFLTTTSGEGFGLTATEAMMCGVPVIYPDTPVLPEVVADVGLMCARKSRDWYERMNVWHNVVDTDDVVTKLEWAYQDWKNGGHKLAELGQKAHERAKATFSPDVVYSQWDSVLNSVCKKKDLVSLVTVIYNVSGQEYMYGPDCTVDKLWQTLKEYVAYPFEWIIVDNGSPHREMTREWMTNAAKADPRIKPIFLDFNYGFAGAHNRAFPMCEGHSVCLINPDSQALDHREKGLPSDFLSMMTARMKAVPGLGLIGMEVRERDDILDGLSFPYFGLTMITRECLDACKTKDGKWFDEAFWPAYYEDADFTIRARAKGFLVEGMNVPFWHISGGTNKHMIEGGKDNTNVQRLLEELEKLRIQYPSMMDYDRKRAEISTSGMQSLIAGNINHLNKKWGQTARNGIKVVWNTHMGDGVGFSQIAEGLVPELHRMGFDVYINDWSNASKLDKTSHPELFRELIEKTLRAKQSGDDLGDAINIVCWLMETFLDVPAAFKVGVAFCESTRVRSSYLNACNSMNRILTFSKFCKQVQKDSGFKVPIDVIPPGVDNVFLKGEPPVRHTGKKKFTFLSVGVAQTRKDTYRLVQAFCEAFPKGQARPPECEPNFPTHCDDVELVLKSNNFGELNWVTSRHRNGEPSFAERANIRTIFTGGHGAASRPDFDMNEMYDMYASADCLVHPSHGEGIGMPILEAAATGLPVIFTNWSSPAEYLNDSNSFPTSLSPYEGTTFTPAYPEANDPENGLWANIHIGHLKHHMYHVVRSRDDAFSKGLQAAKHMRENHSWKTSANALWPLIFDWEASRAKKDPNVEFDPMTFEKPPARIVKKGDRVMLDVTSRNRHDYLATLLTSLWTQTFKDWDITIMCDDDGESMLYNHQLMRLKDRLCHEGHEVKIIRGHQQGPHVSHDRTLKMTPAHYKLVCRIDDDIILRPDYLENLFQKFLEDSDGSLGAVGGVYPDLVRPESMQTAPGNFKQDIMYSAKIEPNVPWPFVCFYPKGTPTRPAEHLYSSFMYRADVGKAIGGYCMELSSIGHREESDFSYRFHLAGYRMLIHPDAVGFHFCAPSGGIRSDSIKNKEQLAGADHAIYERRQRNWRKRYEEKMRMSKGGVSIMKSDGIGLVKEIKLTPSEVKELPAKKLDALPLKKDVLQTVKDKVLILISGTSEPAVRAAVKRWAPRGEVYVTTVAQGIADVAIEEGAVGAATTSSEAAILAKQAMSEGNHEFILQITDTMEFLGDPLALIDDRYDDYVFETYWTYAADEKTIGPEVENRCLLMRKDRALTVDIQRVYYSDIIVLDDARMKATEGKSYSGMPLVPVRDMDSIPWKKACVYQYPTGKLAKPSFMDVVPSRQKIVSIIIPTPGRRQLLKRCIDSIFTYTSTPFEIIVIDNGSSDGTKEFVEAESKKRKNIKYQRSQVNLGYQKAINLGVSLAKGEHILLFNDDAWVTGRLPDGKDWIKTFMDALEESPDIGIVGPHEGVSPALNKHMLFFWCVMLRKSTWDQIGPLDDSTFFNYGGDDDYCERIRNAGLKIVCKDIHNKLTHLMTCVPEHVKKPELEESEKRLKAKWKM